MTESTTIVYPIESEAVSTDERIVSGIVVPWNETSLPDAGPEGRALPAGLAHPDRQGARRPAQALPRRPASTSTTAAIARPLELDARHPDGLWASLAHRQDAGRRRRARRGRRGNARQPSRSASAPSGPAAVPTARARSARRSSSRCQLLPIGAYDGARVLEVRSPACAQSSLDDLDRWLAEHPIPDVDKTPLPELHRWTRRGA